MHRKLGVFVNELLTGVVNEVLAYLERSGVRTLTDSGTTTGEGKRGFAIELVAFKLKLVFVHGSVRVYTTARSAGCVVHRVFVLSTKASFCAASRHLKLRGWHDERELVAFLRDIDTVCQINRVEATIIHLVISQERKFKL